MCESRTGNAKADSVITIPTVLYLQLELVLDRTNSETQELLFERTYIDEL